MRDYKKLEAWKKNVIFIMVLFLSFSYFASFNQGVFPLASASENNFQNFLERFNVSREYFGTYSTSLGASEPGCCFVSLKNEICGTLFPDDCSPDSPFVEGELCSEASFCEKGCCYDELEGIYDKNVLEVSCDESWVNDPNCNLPGASLGCCVLGRKTVFETEGQCAVDSLVLARGGNGIFNWSGGVDEVSCLLLSASQEMGACVNEGGGCEMLSEVECVSLGNDFFKDKLCTSKDVNSSCEMSEKTTCVDGKDGVYFVDSCGNVANVYDSSRVSDASYWDEIISVEESCGFGDSSGNGDSKSCGNCNRFDGGYCALASEDGFRVDVGSFYCRDMSCEFEGKKYRNGESWCVYDGAIGNGDDVVGSRHWKYVCAQGVVQVEPCADYRNQICIQSESVEVDGKNIGFNNAVCIANNWRECLNLNVESEDAADLVEDCQSALNCRVDTIEVADSFKFDVCLPKYPAGFSFSDERYASTADSICKMADMKCIVVREAKTWGGCKYVANEECLDGSKFATEMNDFCRSLGDCGGYVNIVGAYEDSYAVKEDGVISKAMYLTRDWINELVANAKPVEGQFAEVENYTEYLEAAGIWGSPEAVSPGKKGSSLNGVASGVGGLGMALKFAAGSETVTGIVGSGASSFMAGFGGAAIGAGMGMVAGSMLAKSMGLSPGGSILMAVGGGLVGAVAGYGMMVGFAAVPVAGWIIAAIGVALMVIAAFMGGDDCDPIEVSFECRLWEPPSGGEDCEKCNGNLLKPCSEYRCKSLGTNCELINVGSGDELCVDGTPRDVSPPVISRNLGVDFGGVEYIDNSNGFSVVGESGKCLAAYTPLAFGVTTSEPARCRFDVDPGKSFEDMGILFGGSSYLYNHSAVFSLPDPGHLGNDSLNFDGSLSLFVKCVDRSGLFSPGVFKIDLCVNEGPDLTAPSIVSVEAPGNGLVGFDQDSADVIVVTNEPATCRWSFEDVGYSLMENSLGCHDSLLNPSHPFGYVCSGSLPISSYSEDYYIRCMDQPWLGDSGARNVNMESFVFTLRKPDSKISIESLSPVDDFLIGTDSVSIDLNILTSGGAGSHFCSYSFSGYENMIDIFESGNNFEHSVVLNLEPGRKKVYVECRDETGDVARNFTEFEIVQDSLAPGISRVWQNGGGVHLILTEEGECRYSSVSCNFIWDDGVLIGKGRRLDFESVLGVKYYIRCEDDFGNSPSGCSVELVSV